MTEQDQLHTSNLDTKFDMFMKSHEDFKQEMRQQNEMRAEEIREIRQLITGSNHLTVASLIGIAAIMISIWLK